MTVKLTLKVNDTNNNSKTINIGYVSPNASDATLRTFAQKLNSLTTNTLLTTEKTVTTDITSA